MTAEIESAESAMLLRALVEAYPNWVVSRPAAEPLLGVSETLEDAVAEGRRWLAAALADLLAEPFNRQARAPLELFQEAMRFPTAVLQAEKIEPVERDPAAAAALPGDEYGLAPSSSQELGDEVWHAHLAWGAAKARAMTRPVVGLLSVNLMDRSRIESIVKGAGFELAVWSSAGAVAALDRHPVRAYVDLEHPDADEVISLLAAGGVGATAFGPHVDDLAMVRARTLGAADALPRSRFFRTLPELLPTLA